VAGMAHQQYWRINFIPARLFQNRNNNSGLSAHMRSSRMPKSAADSVPSFKARMGAIMKVARK